MIESTHEKLKSYEKYLGDKEWLTGEKVSIIITFLKNVFSF